MLVIHAIHSFRLTGLDTMAGMKQGRLALRRQIDKACSRRAISLVLVAGFMLASFFGGSTQAADEAAAKLLAPSGKLIAALYPGTPTSISKDEGADSKGVGFELGRELAKRLGVPYAPIVYPNNNEVQNAIKSGAADIAFTNSSPARAMIMDFATPFLEIELGYLVPKDGKIHDLAEVDRPGNKIGVTIGSTSETTLGRDLKQAQLVKADNVGIALAMLADGRMDAFATNKATLFEMADKLPGSRALDGRWGLERHAMGIPKGREAALPYLRKFTEDVIAEGLVLAAAKRAGLRGMVETGAK